MNGCGRFPAGTLVLLLILRSNTAFALDPNRTLTQYVHRIWQLQQGLPDATITSIRQTHDGYLWLGTQTGLARFDGVRFTSFGVINRGAQGHVWVRNLLEDERHNLWIGTNNAGLIRIENGVVTHYSRREGLPHRTVQCLFSDRHGDLWVCTPNGLAKVAQGKPVVYRVEEGLSTNNIRAGCEAEDGTLWVGGDGSRLSAWNGTGFVPYPLRSIPAYGGVRAMVCSTGGVMWIGTTNGLIRLKAGRERLFSVKDGLADNRVLSLLESSDGSLWVGTASGFSRLRNDVIDSFRTEDGLSQSSVYSLYEDREGSLWVGTKHGLNQFLEGRAIPYTVSEGLPSNKTGPVLQDHNGTIWVGTLGAGLCRFDGQRSTVLTTAQGLAANFIHALAEDDNGNLWVGGDAGLNRVRGGHVDQTYTMAQGLPSNRIRCLFRDRNGVLWIGTSAGLTTLWDEKLMLPRNFQQAPPASVLAVAEVADRRLFSATEAGLKVYSSGALRQLAQDEMPMRNVDTFYADQDGLLWMGTLGNGLRLLKDGKLISFFMRDGLFDNEIYGIIADNQDRLWMACSKGIFSVNREDLLKFAAGKIQTFTSAPYSPLDGLRTIECKSGVEPVAWRMQDGRLLFSTIRGLLIIDPAQLRRKLASPPVVVEEVMVNGQSENPNRIRELPPGQKNLEFHYTGLSFLAPNRLTFRYKLEGYDQDWSYAGTRREAFYTNLPPGRFRFRVTACNVDGTCNESGDSIAFLLAPRYDQRAWFFPLCAASVALAVWLAYRFRVHRLNRQFDMVLAERSRIARELHDTLIQGFSGVTMEMQALSASLSSPDGQSMLKEIIRDAGNCLREARCSIAGLRMKEPDSGLAATLAQVARQITDTTDIRLKLKLDQSPPSLTAEIEYNLVRIAQEAISNSMKHSGARTIEVRLRCTPGLVHLSVQDDGAGFAEEANGGVPGHFGLTGMKERARHIGAEFQLVTGLGTGTTVCVLLPDWRSASG